MVNMKMVQEPAGLLDLAAGYSSQSIPCAAALSVLVCTGKLHIPRPKQFDMLFKSSGSRSARRFWSPQPPKIMIIRLV